MKWNEGKHRCKSTGWRWWKNDLFRNGLSTEDCYQLGKQLNNAHVHSSAIEWLTEAMKRYDEYYDQHQVKAVEILEELALAFLGNNQIQEAENIVEKVSRMNAKSHVVKFFKTSQHPDITNGKRFSTKAKDKIERQKLCHSAHFLSSNIFTCPIWFPFCCNITSATRTKWKLIYSYQKLFVTWATKHPFFKLKITNCAVMNHCF